MYKCYFLCLFIFWGVVVFMCRNVAALWLLPGAPEVFTCGLHPGLLKHQVDKTLHRLEIKVYNFKDLYYSPPVLLVSCPQSLVPVGALRPQQWSCYWPHWSSWSVCLWPLERITHCGVRVPSVHWAGTKWAQSSCIATGNRVGLPWK